MWVSYFLQNLDDVQLLLEFGVRFVDDLLSMKGSVILAEVLGPGFDVVVHVHLKFREVELTKHFLENAGFEYFSIWNAKVSAAAMDVVISGLVIYLEAWLLQIPAPSPFILYIVIVTAPFTNASRTYLGQIDTILISFHLNIVPSLVNFLGRPLLVKEFLRNFSFNGFSWEELANSAEKEFKGFGETSNYTEVVKDLDTGSLINGFPGVLLEL